MEYAIRDFSKEGVFVILIYTNVLNYLCKFNFKLFFKGQYSRFFLYICYIFIYGVSQMGTNPSEITICLGVYIQSPVVYARYSVFPRETVP